MHFSRLHLIVQIAVIIILVPACCIGETTLRKVDETNLLPNAGARTHREFVDLFSLISNEDFLKLISHSSTSIAIRAAWQRVQNEEIKTLIANRHDALNCRSRFNGFIEGRIGCVLPEWWANAVVLAEIQNGIKIYPKLTFPAHSKASFRRVIGALYKLNDTGTIVLSNPKDCHQKYVFSQEMMGNGEFSDVISACFMTDHIFVAMADAKGNSFKLYKVSLDAGKVVWNSDVRATQTWAGSSGQGTGHKISLLISGDRLILFGGTRLSMYLEVFSIKNGEILARFCTTI